ncbi:protein-glutamate O-methyltransferase CheR [Deltaproteobacteria bacterium TL4]
MALIDTAPTLHPLTQVEFLQLRELLLKVCGISLNDDHHYLIETRLRDYALELGARTFGELYRFIVTQADQRLPEVIERMTTNETLWFRDQSCWNILEKYIIPHFFECLDNGVSKIRIWSAACSTGQEPYSLAILIDELCAKYGKMGYQDRFSILGTDISGKALASARLAQYDSFVINRGLSEQRKKRYFTCENEKWKLNETLSKRVNFSSFNLIGSYRTFEKYHLILCRNVMVYFSSSFQKEVLQKMNSVLHDDGMLMIGASESLLNYRELFNRCEFENGVYYRPIRS